MPALLEELLESTELPIIFEQLSARIEDERVRREKFYDAMTPEQRVEFINGEIIMHSPVQVRHTRVSRRLTNLLSNYVVCRDIGEVFFEKTLVVTTRNDYEPDVLFYGKERAATLKPTQMKCPPPDFVVEILSSRTERHDRGVKFKDYALHGVGEYWIIDPAKETVEKFVLRAAERAYVAEGTYGGGEITSAVVTGFTIPVRALFDDDENRRALDAILRAAAAERPPAAP